MATRPQAEATPGERSLTDPANDDRPLPLTTGQQRLFDLGMPMMKQCAAEVAARWRVRPEELFGPGALALREAAIAYREERHPSFPLYARHHLRGRMIDALQAEPFAQGSRGERIERVMERAYEVVSAHQVVGVDLARDAEEEILAGARSALAETMAAAFLAGLLDEQRDGGEDAMIRRLWVNEGIDALYPHEREVIALVYREGMTLDEAAASLHVHPNTAQRRHAAALLKLHAFFEERGEEAREGRGGARPP